MQKIEGKDNHKNSLQFAKKGKIFLNEILNVSHENKANNRKRKLNETRQDNFYRCAMILRRNDYEIKK